MIRKRPTHGFLFKLTSKLGVMGSGAVLIASMTHAGLTSAIGDVMAQMVFDGTELKSIEKFRTLKLVAFSTCLAAPVGWKVSNKLAATKKTLDDFGSKVVKYECMTSPFVIAGGVGLIGYMKDMDWAALGIKILKETPLIFALSFGITSITAALIIQAASPVTMILVNLVNSIFFWTFFSFITNRPSISEKTEEDNKSSEA